MRDFDRFIQEYLSDLRLPRLHRNGRQRGETGVPVMGMRTTGWESSCAHADDSGRCVVLDPFAGSGTVGVVARWYGRDFVGVELNPEYAEFARRRIDTDGCLGRPAKRPRASEHPALPLFEEVI